MTAIVTHFADQTPSAPAMHGATRSSPARVRTILRLEGAAAFAAAVALYAHAGFSWPLFALLILAPDLAMLPYLIGPRAGAAAYNLAHIGMDRMLGYGLKYASGFADTHLGRIGRN